MHYKSELDKPQLALFKDKSLSGHSTPVTVEGGGHFVFSVQTNYVSETYRRLSLMNRLIGIALVKYFL